MAEAAAQVEEVVVLRITVPGEPCSKARPQWSSKTRTTYTPAKTRAREEAIKAIALAARTTQPDRLALFSVTTDFYLGSNHQRDIDNMAKLVLDGLKGVVWADDVQVVRLLATKTRSRQATARTEIEVSRLPGQMPWTFGACEVCGQEFRKYPVTKTRIYCSLKCAGVAQTRRGLVTIKCAKCSGPFVVRASEVKDGRRFCSGECRGRRRKTQHV